MKKIHIDKEKVNYVVVGLLIVGVFFGVLFVFARGRYSQRLTLGTVLLLAVCGFVEAYESEKSTREKLENELKNCKEELNNNYIYALRLERENKELKKKLGYNIETENEEINEQPEDSFEYDGKIEIEKEHGNEDK